MWNPSFLPHWEVSYLYKITALKTNRAVSLQDVKNIMCLYQSPGYPELNLRWKGKQSHYFPTCGIQLRCYHKLLKLKDSMEMSYTSFSRHFMATNMSTNGWKLLMYFACSCMETSAMTEHLKYCRMTASAWDFRIIGKDLLNHVILWRPTYCRDLWTCAGVTWKYFPQATWWYGSGSRMPWCCLSKQA